MMVSLVTEHKQRKISSKRPASSAPHFNAAGSINNRANTSSTRPVRHSYRRRISNKASIEASLEMPRDGVVSSGDAPNDLMPSSVPLGSTHSVSDSNSTQSRPVSVPYSIVSRSFLVSTKMYTRKISNNKKSANTLKEKKANYMV